ncbi:hypothetical protein [Sporomusa termitida]|uniref:CDP-Glycerol:Poly(Glycerophosphate) glycerophosphotransferase n=1 Tax=Sporomusa termitida TaxID=2377 RepID=A0A517DX77_9FIRM|nr:hypothetical protein [Sporomusa termitida]QDR81958.1 hypothetical protein SPTER_33780 [Sporomusa termitida]
MRSYQQKKILDLIQTLHEANAEIKRFFLRKELASVIQILIDCQDFVVQIGNFIEQIEGEGTKTVSCLEKYCELLYEASLEIKTENGNGNFIVYLQKQLVEIENNAKIELKPNKIEIVFFPYKASMFDCMESIWFAAKEDSQCDAYVVPVPYYDRLPSGGLGQMHYEGGQYPDYVPVVDWQTYNVEERRPDIIVTHNPYDDDNFITSIHPGYYNERLKKFTNLLVYIPYFVCVDDVPEHLCVCAGTLHADKVMVQSEKIRQTYIRVIKEFEKTNHCIGLFGKAKEKFIAIGSPKFDKIIHKKREDYYITDAWKRLIAKPDGRRKKIILYNTSIASLLEGNEKVLHKLRYVFDCFRDRDDIVLWWRPHPLNEAAYQSMRPQLLNEYESIVAQYIHEGFGIYDDTADLHRALAVSDAYYGDSSSLVALYRCTEKPAMIQNVEICSKDGVRNHLAFENLYDDGEFFWFTAYEFNGLFKMEKRTWKAEYMGSFPGEKMEGKRLYTSISSYNEKLYFSPYTANEIAVYDKQNKTFEKFNFNKPKGEKASLYCEDYKFSSVVEFKERVFFLPCSYPAIIQLEPTTGHLEYYSEWMGAIRKLQNSIEDSYFWKPVITGTHAIIPSANANAVLDFDMETGVSTVLEVGKKDYNYFSACFDGKDYWLASRCYTPIIRWDKEKNQCFEYSNYPEGFSSTKYNFVGMCVVEDGVWMLPYQANQALRIDIRNGNISFLNAPEIMSPHNVGKEALSQCYIFMTKVGDNIYACSEKHNCFIEYDCSSQKCRVGEVTVLDKEADKIHEIIQLVFEQSCKTLDSKANGYVIESKLLTLSDFLDFAVQQMPEPELYSERQNEQYMDGTSGTAIYTYAKQTIIG